MMRDDDLSLWGGLAAGLFVIALLFGAASTPAPAHDCDDPIRASARADLPSPERVKNYSGGSCAHASTATCFIWAGREDLAAWWLATYSGGEYFSRLRSRMDAAGVDYVYTDAGEVSVLEYASRTRRYAIIGYYPAHAITFAGFAERPHGEVALVIDNNRTQGVIEIDRAEFERRWKYEFGGEAVVPVLPPVPRLPWSPFPVSLNEVEL